MRIKKLVLSSVVAACLSVAASVHAEITVEVEPELHDDFGCGGFFDDLTTTNPFSRIPNVRTDDAINGIPGVIRNGEDGIGPLDGGVRAFWAGQLPKMTDGLWSGGNDDDPNVWNMASDLDSATLPRLVQWDLGEVMDVREINAYTRHCNTRSALHHDVYGSNAAVAPEIDTEHTRDDLRAPLEALGWEFIANVNVLTAPEIINAEPGFENANSYDGYTGGSIFDDAGASIGNYRYIMFHVLDIGPQDVDPNDLRPAQEEAYAEFDVVAIPILELPEDLNNDGFVDGLDLGLLLGSWNTTTTPELGELNGTPPVDGLDLGLLLGEWNPPGGVTAAAIPEPGSLLLSSLAMLAWMTGRYQTRRGGKLG